MAAGLKCDKLFSNAARRLTNDQNATGQAISQHYDKSRQRMFEAGFMVPPWNGRDNCPTLSRRIRGIIMDRSDEKGWREVPWTEKLRENGNPDEIETASSHPPKTVEDPGKHVPRLEVEDPGWELAENILMRKRHSMADFIHDHEDKKLPNLPDGYSSRKNTKPKADPNGAEINTPAPPPRKRKASGAATTKKAAKKVRNSLEGPQLPASNRRVTRSTGKGKKAKPQLSVEDEEEWGIAPTPRRPQVSAFQSQ